MTIKSKKYAHARIFLRGEVWYLNYRGVKLATPYRKSCKDDALNYLDNFIENIGKDKKVKSIHTVINEFMQLKSFATKQIQLSYKNSFKILDNRLDIDETAKIRNCVINYLKSTKNTSITINKKLTRLKSLFQYAIDEGYITVNPIKKEFQQKAQFDRRPFTETEIDSIIQKAIERKNYMLADIIKFIKITGARINEVLSVKLDDIDEDFILLRGKGGVERHFPLFYFPELRPLLVPKHSKNGLLFGKCVYITMLKQLNSCLKNLGYDSKFLAFHSVRKYAENNMMFNLKLPNRVILSIIGHSNTIQSKHYLMKIQKNEIKDLLENKKMLG